MSAGRSIAPALLALLDGAEFANAIRRNGKPCRIRLPWDSESRAALVRAHLSGSSATLTFHADGRQPWREHVDAVVLAALCPAADGRCRWVGIDLDGVDHGASGLADPIHAARSVAERAADAGLMSGLLVARSRHGQGRHVFLLPPEPLPLADAVIGVAALAAAAFRTAAADMAEYASRHAFKCANGAIARPGDAGAVELVPRSTKTPRHGWALALPAAGAYRVHGGGVIVEPFDDEPVQHTWVPRCNGPAWLRFVAEHRHALNRIQRRHNRLYPRCTDLPRSQRLHPLTAEFVAGLTPKGQRNESAFAAACNLLGNGLPPQEVERQILHGARGCNLPEREALSAIQSALRAVDRSR